MKKLKRIFLIVLIIMFLLITSSSATTGKVISASVRVRESASTSSNIITNIYKDTEVEILEEKNGWYKVNVNGKEGYIKSEFLDKKEDSSDQFNAGNATEETSYTNIKVSVKSIPSFLSNNVGTIDSGKTVIIKDKINNWYKISDGATIGWVLNTKIGGDIIPDEDEEKLETEDTEIIEETDKKINDIEEAKEEKTLPIESENIDKAGIVNVKTARVRSEASTKGEIIDLLDYNDEVTVNEKNGTWYKISYDGKTGYIDASLITLKDEQGVSSRGLTEERLSVKNEEQTELKSNNTEISQQVVSASGQEVVNFAMQYLGYVYVSGGKNPETGFDCSGFTKYIFSNFGYELGATAASQVNVGREVSREELVAGDLLLFYDEGKTKIGHTGIYIGNGDFVHAANSNRGVVTDNINTSTYYNERYITARRIVE